MTAVVRSTLAPGTIEHRSIANGKNEIKMHESILVTSPSAQIWMRFAILAEGCQPAVHANA